MPRTSKTTATKSSTKKATTKKTASKSRTAKPTAIADIQPDPNSTTEAIIHPQVVAATEELATDIAKQVPQYLKADLVEVDVRGKTYQVRRYYSLVFVQLFEAPLREFAKLAGITNLPAPATTELLDELSDATTKQLEQVEQQPGDNFKAIDELLNEKLYPTYAINSPELFEAIGKMKGNLDVFVSLLANTYLNLGYQDLLLTAPGDKAAYTIALLNLYRRQTEGE